MSMHLIRGMSSLNTKKRKAKKSPGWKEKEESHQAFLLRMGVSDEKKKKYTHDIPNYKTEGSHPSTSDKICGHGPKRQEMKYTGTEIEGIATMHKSNAVPVRRGTTEAIDIANMRRN
jgi:hypothetical protein